MTHRAKLASEPYFEQVLNPDPYFPQRDRVVRCDCFLLDADNTPVEPPALIQLVGGPRIMQPLPVGWKAGDILILTPTMSLGWNDTQGTGRCYVDLGILVACEGREGFLSGMVPKNPNIYDFSKDAET
jgi:hypothetical protein